MSSKTKLRANKAATQLLSDNGWIRADEVVNDLVEGGFLDEDPLTEPERFAQAARDWVRGDVVFCYAVGWSQDSWKTVLDETWEDYDADKHRSVFYALVILAKEAGIDLNGS